MPPPPCAYGFDLIPIPANNHKTITMISGERQLHEAPKRDSVTSVSLHLAYQLPPNAAFVLASTASQRAVRSSPRTAAMARIVSGTR
jgi:hypothetical protein